MVAGCPMLLGFAARMPWRRRSQLLLSVIRRGQTRVRDSLPLDNVRPDCRRAATYQWTGSGHGPPSVSDFGLLTFVTCYRN